MGFYEKNGVWPKVDTIGQILHLNGKILSAY